MKIYTYKDEDGVLRPKAFMAKENELEFCGKEIERLTKNGGEIVLVEILEIN